MIGFALIIVLIFIVAPVFIGWLIYFITKRMGHPKLAKWLTLGYFTILFMFAVMTLSNDELFTKDDAQSLLAIQDIHLKQEFRILENKSEWLGDFYHTFTLSIAEQDKNDLIRSIRYPTETEVNNNPLKTVNNYENENAFVRELSDATEEGYAPVKTKITINKTGNTLVYESY